MNPTVEYGLSTEIRDNWAEICRVNNRKPPAKNSKDAGERASVLYANTCKSELPFVILGRGIRANKELVANFKYITTKTLDKRAVDICTGSILDGESWSQLKNDVFMLAVINSKKDVYVIPDENHSISEKTLWNPDEGCLTHFGREIAILCIAGYQRVQVNPDMGIVFQASCVNKLSEICLSQLMTKVKAFKLIDLKRFLS